MAVRFPYWAYNLNGTAGRTLGKGTPVTLAGFGPFNDATNGKYGGGTILAQASAFGSTHDNLATFIEGNCSFAAWMYRAGADSFRAQFRHSSYGYLAFGCEYAGSLSARRFTATGASNFSATFLAGWNHVVFVRSSGTVDCYLNGEFAGTIPGTSSNSSANGNSSYEIGQDDNYSDEWQAFDFAMTADEVAELYALPIANVAYYPYGKRAVVGGVGISNRMEAQKWQRFALR